MRISKQLLDKHCCYAKAKGKSNKVEQSVQGIGMCYIILSLTKKLWRRKQYMEIMAEVNKGTSGNNGK